MPRTVRNALLVDPDTGERRVIKANTEVDEATAALLHPRSFGKVTSAVDEIAGQEPVQVRVVDEAPLLDALRTYARGRGLEVTDELHGFDILDLLVDADEAEPPAADGAADPEAARIAKLLEGGVDDVNAHLAEHPEDAEAVLAAEAASAKPRKSITEGPHAPKQQE